MKGAFLSVTFFLALALAVTLIGDSSSFVALDRSSAFLPPALALLATCLVLAVRWAIHRSLDETSR